MDISNLPDDEAYALPPLFPAERPQLSTVISSEAQAYRFVSKQEGQLSKVPEDYRTENVCAAAVQRSGTELRHVPDEQKSYWLCTDAVENNGLALAWVPPEHRDYNLCLLAVDSHGMALPYVPEEHRTDELLAVAEDSMTRLADAMPRMPYPVAEPTVEKPTKSGLRLVVNQPVAEVATEEESVKEAMVEAPEENFNFAEALENAYQQSQASKGKDKELGRDR